MPYLIYYSNELNNKQCKSNIFMLILVLSDAISGSSVL